MSVPSPLQVRSLEYAKNGSYTGLARGLQLRREDAGLALKISASHRTYVDYISMKNICKFAFII